MTLLSFLFVTALVGFITWLMTRKDDHRSKDGYFLGGRSLTFPFIAGSLLLTNLSTEQHMHDIQSGNIQKNDKPQRG